MTDESDRIADQGHDPTMHRRRHGTRTRKGKALVALMMFLFWGTYIITYGMTYLTVGGSENSLRANVIISAIWTTFLFICIWNRQKWARYVLLALLSISLLFSLIFLYTVMISDRPVGQPWNPIPLAVMGLNLVVNAIVFGLLLKSKAIRHLTSYNALA